MQDKNAENAVDIIYELPRQLAEILEEVRGLKTRNAMLEAKLNGVSAELTKLRADSVEKAHHAAAPAAQAPAPAAVRPTAAPADNESEVMEAVTRVPPARPAPSGRGGPASLPQKVVVPTQDIDPLQASTPPAAAATKAATHVRGRVKDRDGTGAAGIEVKIMTLDNNLVKKTKTSAGGVWLAFLQPGEYTVECTKPGQRSPVFKSLIIQDGQREIDLIL